MTWTQQAQELSGLEPFAQKALSHLGPMDVGQGTVLFRPGEPVQGFVIVLSGRVEVFLTGPTGREILLYSVEPGQSCIQSTLGLLGGEDYTGEAITQSACRIVVIPRGVFADLMARSDVFRTFVFKAFAARMQTMMHLLEKVTFHKVEARLAEELVARAQEGVVHATHAELAVMIGSAREVVSRRLDALARQGVVALDRGEVRILQPQLLEQLSQG